MASGKYINININTVCTIRIIRNFRLMLFSRASENTGAPQTRPQILKIQLVALLCANDVLMKTNKSTEYMISFSCSGWYDNGTVQKGNL